MPRYFFDQKNGRRIVDAVGVSCNDDISALANAKFIATKLSIEKPYEHQRYIAVLNESGDEIHRVIVQSTSSDLPVE